MNQGPVSGKILSPLVIVSMEKTTVAKVISELKSVSRLKICRKVRMLKILLMRIKILNHKNFFVCYNYLTMVVREITLVQLLQSCYTEVSSDNELRV